jgi:predicted phosphohydrolase
MKIAWMSDVHLNCADEIAIQAFITELAKATPDCVIITGDISVSVLLKKHLWMIENAVKVPVYFICGNHDFWGGSFNSVAFMLMELEERNPNIKWLSNNPYIKLSDNTVIVGHDCFYDAGYGDWTRSNLLLNDWFKISDFKFQPQNMIVDIARNYAVKGANHIFDNLTSAINDGYEHSIVLMHPPPFAEASLYKGMPASDYSLPWYSCKVAGDALLSIAEKYKSIDVFCGHTHSKCTYTPLDNLTVRLENSQYGYPSFHIINLNY